MTLNFPIFLKQKQKTNDWNTSVSLLRNSIFAAWNNHLVAYPTPGIITYWWGLGSLAGIFLALQIISGLMLAMHYTPNAALAFDALEHIMRDVNNGWILRSLHANGASFFFFIVYLHIGRGLYYFSYIWNPLVWISGMILFALMMAIAFMGYVLPWGQMSFWGATVITNLFSAIPIIGQKIAFWLWGGFSVDNPTLNRFFVLHFVLPFLLLALVLLHLILLHRYGSTNPLALWDKNIEKIPFFPYFYWKDMLGLLAFSWFYLLFTFFFPDTLGHPDNYIEGNPMVTPTHIVPEWYFLPFYAILRSIPDKLGGVILMAVSIIVYFLLPIWNSIATKLNKEEGIGIGFFEHRANKAFHIIVWFFFSNVVLLAWIGSQPVTNIIVTLGQLNTILYFWWIIYFPIFFFVSKNEAVLIVATLSVLKKVILIIILLPHISLETIKGWITIFFNWAQQHHFYFWEHAYSLCATPFIPFIIKMSEKEIKQTIALILFSFVFFSWNIIKKTNLKFFKYELLFITLTSVIPLCILTFWHTNWIYIYLLLELSTLSTTVLIAAKKYNPYALSASLIYFFFSALSAIFLALGIFFICFKNGGDFRVNPFENFLTHKNTNIIPDNLLEKYGNIDLWNYRNIIFNNLTKFSSNNPKLQETIINLTHTLGNVILTSKADLFSNYVNVLAWISKIDIKIREEDLAINYLVTDFENTLKNSLINCENNTTPRDDNICSIPKYVSLELEKINTKISEHLDKIEFHAFLQNCLINYAKKINTIPIQNDEINQFRMWFWLIELQWVPGFKYNVIEYLYTHALLPDQENIAMEKIFKTNYLYFCKTYGNDTHIGEFFIIVAFLIKLGCVPAHNWNISVNAGATLTTTAYIQTIYKLLLIIIFTLLLALIELYQLKTEMSEYLSFFLLIIGILTMSICTLTAIMQSTIKQFWAHLSTATVGFIVVLISVHEYALAIAYGTIYSLASLIFFEIILLLQKQTQMTFITDLKKIKQYKWWAICITYAILIIAGLPPLIGFYLKVSGYIKLVAIIDLMPTFFIMLIHLISSFLYLKILKIIWFDKITVENTKINSETTQTLTNYIKENISLTIQIILISWITIHWDNVILFIEIIRTVLL